MTGLVFGQHRVCSYCKGSGKRGRSKESCTACGGSGVWWPEQPVPEKPAPAPVPETARRIVPVQTLSGCSCGRDPGSFPYVVAAEPTQQLLAQVEALAAELERKSRRAGRRDSVNDKTPEDALAKHRVGAMAEALFAHTFGLEWTASVDTFGSVPDVLPDWEVRARIGWLNVIIRDNDLEEPRRSRRYASAVLMGDEWRFYGWLRPPEVEGHPKQDYGDYGKRSRFVPVELLHRFPEH